MVAASKYRFRIESIPVDWLSGFRAPGLIASRAAVEYLLADGGEPLRCCLKVARPGEQLILFGYTPPLSASPYRETGAVLAHGEPCAGPASVSTYPADFRGRPQVLRAFDARGWIHSATTMHDGCNPEEAINEVLRSPGVDRIHSRNVTWGCYMFTITH